MSDSETSPPPEPSSKDPQFEVPSRLPEEMVKHLKYRITDPHTDVSWSPLLWGAVKMIERIPPMVEEIGRLKQENSMLKARSHRIGVDVTEAFSDNQRLRALNAELREALQMYGVHPRACTVYDRLKRTCDCGYGVILAKSESQSAPSQRGNDLPAQDPSVCHHRPAPGGTSTESETR